MTIVKNGASANHDSESILILAVIRHRATITTKDIASRTSIPERTVKRRLAVFVRGRLLVNNMRPRQRPEWKITRAGFAALTKVTTPRPQVIDVSGATLALVGNASASTGVKSPVPSGLDYPPGSGDVNETIRLLRQEIAQLRVRNARMDDDRHRLEKENRALRATVPVAPKRKVIRLRQGACKCDGGESWVVVDRNCGGRHPGLDGSTVRGWMQESERKQRALEADLKDTRRLVGRLTGEMDGVRTELEQLREICKANGLIVSDYRPPGQWSFDDLAGARED